MKFLNQRMARVFSLTQNQRLATSEYIAQDGYLSLNVDCIELL